MSIWVWVYFTFTYLYEWANVLTAQIYKVMSWLVLRERPGSSDLKLYPSKLLHSRPDNFPMQSDTPWPFWAPLGEGICSLTFKIRSVLFVDSADLCGEVPNFWLRCPGCPGLYCRDVDCSRCCWTLSAGTFWRGWKVWEVNWINTIWTSGLVWNKTISCRLVPDLGWNCYLSYLVCFVRSRAPQFVRIQNFAL